MKQNGFTSELTWIEARVSAEPKVPLLKEPEDGVKEHGVARLPRRIQELPCRHIVMTTNTTDESQSTENLLLGEENLYNLIVSGGESLLTTHTHTKIKLP